MNDNTTASVFGFDLGNLFEDVSKKFAESKGYKDIYDLGVGEAAKNVARLTDRPGEDIKQTPAVMQQGEWSKQISAALPFEVKLSNAQLAIGGVILAAGIFLLLRK